MAARPGALLVRGRAVGLPAARARLVARVRRRDRAPAAARVRRASRRRAVSTGASRRSGDRPAQATRRRSWRPSTATCRRSATATGQGPAGCSRRPSSGRWQGCLRISTGYAFTVAPQPWELCSGARPRRWASSRSPRALWPSVPTAIRHSFSTARIGFPTRLFRCFASPDIGPPAWLRRQKEPRDRSRNGHFGVRGRPRATPRAKQLPARRPGRTGSTFAAGCRSALSRSCTG